MQEKLDERNHQDNKGDDQKDNQGGLSGKKQVPNNTIVAMNKSKKGSKYKSIDELLEEQCPYHPHHKHSAVECEQLKKRGLAFTPKQDKAKSKDKADEVEDQDKRDKAGES